MNNSVWAWLTSRPKTETRKPASSVAKNQINWRADIDGVRYEVLANTKSEARAAVKKLTGKAIPPCTEFARAA